MTVLSALIIAAMLADDVGEALTACGLALLAPALRQAWRVYRARTPESDDDWWNRQL